ncbi:Transcriptional regulator, AbiEi antitoxin, Type IV TA system [Friedmanniella luteola]|uniref:Transcriptional regulator, AbiEi antitoxin, Type IV TA system n=1 Tax=Friedmanniella luteola TaxID=546871 RepID=A0A1H2AB76_9ACTN|nr:type IV toxin-antitoxin system AbiEi family antitoxin domain-containing protein [Friedmanniella luteola]SDT43231.1 Transcriptional regulator, AbiEi antitoxin, Type IV TA system [Friedmanniella luteola]
MSDHPVLTRDLLAAGYSPAEVARLVRSGELVRLRRGAYRTAADLEPDAETRHRQLLLATVPLLAPDSVLSHRSAAVVLGLPVVGALGRVEITRSSVTSGKVRGAVHLRAAPLPDDEVTSVDGWQVTTPARTVVDLARTLPLGPAVAAGDAALRAGTSVEEVESVLASSAGRPGLAAARRACRSLDGRSESAGESLSRVVLHRLGLPPSGLQHEVRSADGALVGRCDFVWEEQRTLGEFDGRVKYGRLLRPGQRAEDVLWAEKLREDALRDLGWQIVRWTWADLDREIVLADRLHRAFRRTAR